MRKMIAVVMLVGCVGGGSGSSPTSQQMISKAKAQALDQVVDGGLDVYGPITLHSPHGAVMTITPTDFDDFGLFKPDGGEYGYLIIDSDYTANNGELFSGSITLLDDSDCYSFPTGYCAMGEDVGASSLGTIAITNPYSLRVGHSIDAGSISVGGQGVCTSNMSCP